MKEIDITLPVLIDRVTQEVKATIEIVQQETGVADSLVECALERVLLEMKSNRVNLYGTTLFHMGNKANENNTAVVEDILVVKNAPEQSEKKQAKKVNKDV